MIGIPFSNETLKQAVTVFGSLFNNLVIRRKDGTIVPVPIAYGPRDKWKEAQKVMDQEEEMFEKVLPRISYEVVAMNYDQMRKLTNKQTVTGKHDGTNRNVQRVSAPVPYNVDFSLYLQTKNLNDGWQVVEQILPFFTPSYTVRVRNFPVDNDSDSPIPTNEYDMPFTLLATTWSDDWTGDIGERRMVEWQFEFQTKVWFSAPVLANRAQVIYDSRAVISAPNDSTQELDLMSRNSGQVGVETGYVVVDSETLPVSFANDSDTSPNVINTLTEDGVITKIVRKIDTF